MTTSLDRCGCGAAVSPPTVLCWTCAGERRTLPNAKPAEPPACLPGCRPAYSVRIMSGPIQGDQIDHWPNCPNAPKPAVCPACRFHPTAEPPSEPPIDFTVCPACYHHITLAPGSSYADLLAERDALRAENAAKYEEIASERHCYTLLEAERQRLYDENAALKARVEELSESLLWATSSYEERVVILANREKRKEQEASNGK